MALTPEEQRTLRRMERELQARDPELEERMRHPLVRWWTHYAIGLILLVIALATALAPVPNGHSNGGYFTVSGVTFVAGWFFGRARRIRVTASPPPPSAGT